MRTKNGIDRTIFVLAFFLGVLVVLVGTISFAGEVSLDESSPPLVYVFWDDDVSEGPSTGLEQISVELESTTDEKVQVTASLLFVGEGDPIAMEIGKKNLKSEESVIMEADVADLTVQSSSISTQIIAHVLVELQNGDSRSYHSEPRYFHIDPLEETATIYNEKQMADEFNGGLVDENDTTIDLTTVTRIDYLTEEESEELDRGGGETVLSNGMLSRDERTYPVMVCGRWRTWFEDVGIGEDKWTSTGLYVKAKFTRARIMKNGVTKWYGYLDENGCTPTIDLT